MIARTLILLVGLVHASALMAVAQLPEPDPVFSAPPPQSVPFPAWLQGVREEALARGISAPTVATALADITPVEQILNRDRTQAEFKETLDEYIARRIGVPTIRLGRQMRDTHRPVLEKVAAAYKVPPHVLVAVWGLESNFGRFSGVRPLMPTLATLAYDDRRGPMFRSQLFDALTILDAGYIDLPRLKGSWAGAMGQPQFMPSSYLKYAVDFDADGRKDIWSSQADVFGSIGNYLSTNGWTAGQTWGRQVTLPTDTTALTKDAPLRTAGCRAAKELTEPRPLGRWQALGVRTMDGGALPQADIMASLLRTDSGAFLVYPNYEVLLSYNCAHAYAMAVARLSDRVVDTDPLPVAKAPAKKTKKKATTARKHKR
ncbi:Membrane-bound lytic murein transglycosylase B precursor [Luteitalea pratensis]|uniref:Membrane-bound lytic murein transglycosylase B n=1 Tax=Luteitalea pratensis TaxID=1855912 RepID=A0A143PUJ9_LUTPR|nr:Membrane-bound lytic murein transglycosylase B precursor [Luteitalea pratensis]